MVRLFPSNPSLKRGKVTLLIYFDVIFFEKNDNSDKYKKCSNLLILQNFVNWSLDLVRQKNICDL